MKISRIDYFLSKTHIAQKPVSPRDSSKLLVVDRKSQKITHHIFWDLPNLINKNCVLVFNNTKVFPARIFGIKKTGGKVEILLLRNTALNTWEAIYKGKVKFGDI